MHFLNFVFLHGYFGNLEIQISVTYIFLFFFPANNFCLLIFFSTTLKFRVMSIIMKIPATDACVSKDVNFNWFENYWYRHIFDSTDFPGLNNNQTEILSGFITMKVIEIFTELCYRFPALKALTDEEEVLFSLILSSFHFRECNNHFRFLLEAPRIYEMNKKIWGKHE